MDSALERSNALIVDRLVGVPLEPANRQSDADPRHPAAILPGGDGHSASGSTSGSDPALLPAARVLRLAWCAP